MNKFRNILVNLVGLQKLIRSQYGQNDIIYTSMKQTLLFFLFTFLAFGLSAQLEFEDESIEKFFLAPGTYDVENKLPLNNIGSDAIDFIWDVETVYAPDGWNFFVCDLNKCYGPGTISIDASAANNLPSAENAEMRFHLQPYEIEGSGQYILRLRNTAGDETLEEMVLTFNGALVDTKEEQIAEMNIFPNPVGDFFKLNNDSGLASHIQVFDVLGRQVKSFEVNSNNEYSIDELAEGRYFARIFDDNGRALKVVRMIKRYNKA